MLLCSNFACPNDAVRGQRFCAACGPADSLYELPVWQVGTHLVRCGRPGIRAQRDVSHAARIRREAKANGFLAHVSVTGAGSAIVVLVALTPVRA